MMVTNNIKSRKNYYTIEGYNDCCYEGANKKVKNTIDREEEGG